MRMGARNKHRVLSLVLKSGSKVFQKNCKKQKLLSQKKSTTQAAVDARFTLLHAQCGASLRILTLRLGARNEHRVLSLVLKSGSKVFQKIPSPATDGRRTGSAAPYAELTLPSPPSRRVEAPQWCLPAICSSYTSAYLVSVLPVFPGFLRPATARVQHGPCHRRAARVSFEGTDRHRGEAVPIAR